MRVLIFGATGFVMQDFLMKDVEIIRLSSKDCDIRDADQVRSTIEKYAPGVVINAAAFTDVRKAQEQLSDGHSSLAYQINVVGAVNIAKVALEMRIFYIQISTGFVQASNASWYGATKREAERLLLDLENEGLSLAIVRADYPFGLVDNPRDFLAKTINLAYRGNALIENQQIAPTYLPDFYEALNRIIRNQITGVFNVVVNNITTPFGLGKLISEQLPNLPLLRGISYEEFVVNYLQVPMAKSNYLDVRETQEKLGMRFHSIEDAVFKYLSEWKKPRCLGEIWVNELDFESSTFMRTPIQGLTLIRKPIYRDNRGSFQEVLRIEELVKFLNLPAEKIVIRQMQRSESEPRVIRGIHAEQDMHKIVTPYSGEVMSVYVDLRLESPDFGKWLKVYFNPNASKVGLTSLFIPSGVGNSICVFAGTAIYNYAQTREYDPSDSGRGVSIFDMHLGIDWMVDKPIISERDENMGNLEEFYPEWFR